MTCASCGLVLTVGGGAFRSSPAGLVCEPCAGVVPRETVRAIVQAAVADGAVSRLPGMSRHMQPVALPGGRYDGRKGRRGG